MLGLILLFLLGASLIGTPIGLAVAGIEIGFMSSAIMVGAGIFLIILTGILAVITKLYHRARANEAFVRTGWGGMKVIQDGGALIIPVLHEFLRISLETLKLEVRREGTDALITQDKLRADIGAEFFVKVQPDDKSILQASRSLGDRMTDARLVREAVEDKLISALRTVAAMKTLNELHSDRETFVEEVTKAVNDDLAQNGLKLESVTISRLDQTPTNNLSDGNIFDAQGLAAIAAITEAKKTERNNLQREGEQARKQKDVQTKKALLQLEQDQQTAEATQAAEIAKVRAEQDRISKEESIKAQRAVELAELEKMRNIEIANIEKQQATKVAEEAKIQAIAEAAKLKAAKEAELAKAQALREKETQAVKTVEVEATAERDKRQAVIAAEAKAEQIFVSEVKAADAKAYQVQKDAEARKAAADADAEAVTKKAQAEAHAAKAKAEGERAQALVPVEVEREKVKIEQDRFNQITKPELEARERHGKVAQDFEIAKLQVDADRQIRIETARAMATIGEKITMTLYGSPEHAAGMLKSLMNGQQVASVINAFSESIDPKVGETVMGAVESVGKLLGGETKEPQETPGPWCPGSSPKD
jgi:flotillin